MGNRFLKAGLHAQMTRRKKSGNPCSLMG